MFGIDDCWQFADKAINGTMAQWDDILSVVCSILIFNDYAFCQSYFLKHYNYDMIGWCSEGAVTFYVSFVKKNKEICIHGNADA